MALRRRQVEYKSGELSVWSAASLQLNMLWNGGMTESAVKETASDNSSHKNVD